MKLTYDIIKQKALLAQKHSLYSEMKKSIQSISGTPLVEIIPEKEEDFIKNHDKNLESLLVLLTPDDLSENGTTCGNIGNKCFNKRVIDFLKSKNVTEVFCSVVHDLINSLYRISGAEIKISEVHAEKLSSLISGGHGSWRPDVGINKDYQSFESE